MGSLVYYGHDKIDSMPSTITTSDKSFDIEEKWKFKKGIESTDFETSQITLKNSETNSIAERFESNEELATGSIVALGGEKEIKLATTDDKVFGVIVENPSIKLKDIYNDNTHPFVAWCGKVDCRVIGIVHKFDKIYVSSTAGVGVGITGTSADDRCIGIALENKASEEEGLIKIVAQAKLF